MARKSSTGEKLSTTDKMTYIEASKYHCKAFNNESHISIKDIITYFMLTVFPTKNIINFKKIAVTLSCIAKVSNSFLTPKLLFQTLV